MSAQEVLSLFEKHTIKSTSDNVVHLELASIEEVDTFCNEINHAGYNDTVRRLGAECQVKTGAIYWNSGKILFTSAESLFEECETQNKVPTGLLFFDDVKNRFVEFTSDLDFHKKLQIFVKLRELLIEIADYCIHNEEVVFLIKNDDGGVKHKVSLSLDYESFISAFEGKDIDLTESVKLLDKLKQKVNLDDAQDKERRNCMRSAFDVIIQALKDEDEIFPYTLVNIVKFEATYTAHHNMFLSEFTINKVIQEINTKDLEYTGKINDITSSVQTKALAIPGAMVAIAAVMKVESVSSAVGVIIALFLTCLTIQRSLDIYKASFEHLSKQVSNVFSRYQVLSHKCQVRSEAKTTEDALEKLIDKGESGLNFVRNIIWGVWVASFILIGIQFYQSYETTSSVSHEKTQTKEKSESITAQNKLEGNNTISEIKPEELQPSQVQAISKDRNKTEPVPSTESG